MCSRQRRGLSASASARDLKKILESTTNIHKNMSKFDLSTLTNVELADLFEQADRHRVDRDIVHVALANVICVVWHARHEQHSMAQERLDDVAKIAPVIVDELFSKCVDIKADSSLINSNATATTTTGRRESNVPLDIGLDDFAQLFQAYLHMCKHELEASVTIYDSIVKRSTTKRPSSLFDGALLGMINAVAKQRHRPFLSMKQAYSV